MNIGVLCPSEIAIRRFMPAMVQVEGLHFAGIGVNSISERYGDNLPQKSEINNMLERENEKADVFINHYGGCKYKSYEDLISSKDIDCVYIPLPPALHYKWARKAIMSGKQVMVEKPATIFYRDTYDLVELARKKNVTLHENYMFIFHNQLDAIEDIIRRGEIGEVRLYRISFGFPKRAQSDFRYNKSLGGGALIDAGGYTVKYARRLLGNSASIAYAHLNYLDSYDVDMFGNAIMVNQQGVTAQIAFGMDNDYKCELEVWGSKGTLRTGRVLTAPVGFVPTVSIKKNTEIEERPLPADDSFKKSIEFFVATVNDPVLRERSYNSILEQAKLMDDFVTLVNCRKDNGCTI